MKRKKLSIAAAFCALLAAGALSASAVAGKGPLSVQQTVSTTTTTGSTSTTTGSTTTNTGSTTTNTGSTTTTVVTTTTPAPRKITICHHVFSKTKTKHVTLRISRSAWNAHQRHGDSLGACNTATAKKAHNRKAHVKRFHHGRGK